VVNSDNQEFKFPEGFDPNETVLFLGSGFSYGAKAVNGEGLPLGGQLDDRLAIELGLEPGRYLGKTLAQFATKNEDLDLRTFLHENLTVKSYMDYHRQILSKKWFRVYTTNFDDLVEVVRDDLGDKVEPITFRDSVPNKIRENSVVHLHGYIGRVQQGNASSELIYAMNAYASLQTERPEWFAEFNRSIKFAKNVMFIGYSVEYDEHVRDMLNRVPDLKGKNCFVLGGNVDPVQDAVLSDYGSVYWGGAEGFARALNELQDQERPPIDVRRMRSFDLFDPTKDQKAVSAVTFSEVRNLIAFGSYNRNRFYRDLDDGNYLIFRNGNIKKVINLMEGGSSVLLHSHLGNGKTLFLETLSGRTLQQGIQSISI